jgi:alkanesulfonate monooxygenase SsuD/methylene tetrahydromethanopterin reductase-like flavin-dependent oxidoreductase (luciferase family)
MEVYIRYDLIHSPGGPSTSTLAETALEQAQWADGRGFSTIQVPEHHGTTCGYNPSPILFAAAIAARTKIVKLQTVLLLPFYDAVRVGEELCMLDQISKGRLEVVIALGYVPDEFEMFGVDLKGRGAVAEAKLEVLRKIFDGETFEFEGRRGRVEPGPYRSGGPPLYIGGALKATVRRAARYGNGLYPLLDSPEFIEEYRRACADLGKTPGRIVKGDFAESTIYVSDDPERAWSQLAPYANQLHNYYADASRKAGQETGYPKAADPDDLRRLNRYRVMTPDEAIAFCREEGAKNHFIVIHPLIGGMPAELSWPALEMFADKVLPALKDL